MARGRTIVIYGLAVKSDSPRTAGDYADINLVYNVSPEVSLEDVEYYIRRAGIRLAAVGPAPMREHLEGTIAVDNSRVSEGNPKPMNRIAFGKQLTRDLRNMDWSKDRRRG